MGFQSRQFAPLIRPAPQPTGLASVGDMLDGFFARRQQALQSELQAQVQRENIAQDAAAAQMNAATQMRGQDLTYASSAAQRAQAQAQHVDNLVRGAREKIGGVWNDEKTIADLDAGNVAAVNARLAPYGTSVQRAAAPTPEAVPDAPQRTAGMELADSLGAASMGLIPSQALATDERAAFRQGEDARAAVMRKNEAAAKADQLRPTYNIAPISEDVYGAAIDFPEVNYRQGTALERRQNAVRQQVANVRAIAEKTGDKALAKVASQIDATMAGGGVPEDKMTELSVSLLKAAEGDQAARQRLFINLANQEPMWRDPTNKIAIAKDGVADIVKKYDYTNRLNDLNAFNRMLSVSNPDSSLDAALFGGLYTKYAQGQVGVTTKEEWNRFFQKAGSPVENIENALYQAFTGKMGPEKYEFARKAMEKLRAVVVQPLNQARREAKASWLNPKVAGPDVAALLMQGFPVYDPKTGQAIYDEMPELADDPLRSRVPRTQGGGKKVTVSSSSSSSGPAGAPLPTPPALPAQTPTQVPGLSQADQDLLNKLKGVK